MMARNPERSASQRAGVVPDTASFRERIIPRRHPWRWVASIVFVLVLAGVVIGFSQADISWPSVGGYIASQQFLIATLNVILLAVLAQVAAIVLGLVITMMRTSRNPVAVAIAWFYVWIFRGVPLLLQIILWYNLALVLDRVTLGIPGTPVVFFSESTNDLITPLVAALLGLALNESAYMSEIIRGGLKSVDGGQSEAASALGMSPFRIMRRVVLPQAMRAIIPPTGNEFINMLKTTSLASIVTYPELVYVAQNTAAVNLQVIETLFAAAFWYMVAVSVFSVFQYFVERRFDASTRVQRDSMVRRLLGVRRTAPADQAARSTRQLEKEMAAHD